MNVCMCSCVYPYAMCMCLLKKDGKEACQVVVPALDNVL